MLGSRFVMDLARHAAIDLPVALMVALLLRFMGLGGS